jgi:hypothetical protein
MIMPGLLSPDLVVVMLLFMLVHDVILCFLQKHITFLSFTTSLVHVFYCCFWYILALAFIVHQFLWLAWFHVEVFDAILQLHIGCF